jgi:hypothetical protein
LLHDVVAHSLEAPAALSRCLHTPTESLCYSPGRAKVPERTGQPLPWLLECHGQYPSGEVLAAVVAGMSNGVIVSMAMRKERREEEHSGEEQSEGRRRTQGPSRGGD